MTPYEQDLQMLRWVRIMRVREERLANEWHTRLRAMYGQDAKLPPIFTMMEQQNPPGITHIIVERFNNWK